MSVTDAPSPSSTTVDAPDDKSEDTLEDKIDRLSSQVDYLVTETRRQAELFDMVGEFLHDAAPLAKDAMNTVVTQLAELEAQGSLDAMRQLAQPELLSLLQDMVEAVRIEQKAVATEPVDPPSLWQLVRQLRDPEVRRGLGRALDTVRVVSVTTTSDTHST